MDMMKDKKKVVKKDAEMVERKAKLYFVMKDSRCSLQAEIREIKMDLKD